MNIKIPQNLEEIAEEKPIDIRIEIPTNVYFLSGIRNFTVDAARNVAGFDEQWAHRLQTIVDELVNNAIEHGSAPDDRIKMNFLVEKEKSIEVMIADNGSGKSQMNAEELNKKIEEARARAGTPTLDLRGRGFQIISSWTDEFEFLQNEKGGITVRFKKMYQAPTIAGTTPKSKTGENVLVLEV